MNKELQALLESELLSDEVKTELNEAVTAFKDSIVEDTKKSVEIEYAKKLTSAKEKLAKEVMEKVTELVSEEMKELTEDVAYYKDLDITYAKKLEEFKSEYAEKLSEGFDEAIKAQVTSEVEELREDLVEAKKHNLGKRIFEAFKDDFEEFGVTEDVKEMQEKLEASTKSLAESNSKIDDLNRDSKMKSLLDNLTGSRKEVMKTILENVETDKLDERYKEAIDSVLEDDSKGDEEEATGEEIVVESSKESDDKARLRKLANIR